MKVKQIVIVGLLVATAGLMSFSLATKSEKYDLILEKSKLEWVGKKVGGQHEGTVDIKSGSFEADGSIVTGGSFVMDMTSMIPTDTKGGDTKKLRKHLRSKDFFNVEKYPTSTMTIKKSEKTGEKTYKVTADLTILGKTNEISFDAKTIAHTENFLVSYARIEIDRTKWGIVYKSSAVGEALIKDNFEVKVKLFGKIVK